MENVALIKDPKASAKEAGLRYFREDQLKLKRVKNGKKFDFIDEAGHKIKDAAIIERINSLALPPAWTDVIISPAANSHLQAIGTDEKGRKQYRYHPDWNKFRSETKFDKMTEFGKALPKIRAKMAEDLNTQGLSRDKVLAAIVKLLEKTMIRIGNEEYAKENQSYGLTTLRNKHVDVGATKVKINFKGKSGKFHNIELEDRRLARLIGKLQDLPGQELFQYVDEAGERHSVDSADVNEYIQAAAEAEFTAKDFRTWRGTILAALFLADQERTETETANKKLVTDIVKQVAAELGNTPTVCRKCYIHPYIIESFFDGNLVKLKEESEIEVDTVDLLPEEKKVLVFLQRAN
ncbi:MAG TPA: hypothetical protein VLE93_01435 [Candidatus Saccharimonadales bacterium]|nr:hypothetical protein [Candidatus Saccharimonadales bacterium]